MLQKNTVALFKPTSAGKRFFENILLTIHVLSQRAQQRRQLIELDDQQLKDIGVTRVDALQEYQKHFWQE
ncbi:MAG: DUF1127 domain-containing protein [SAR324 cluster bacterium]|nr:DUF1127 domain-containing protein [SAR324 cluster bacterium]